MNGIQQAIVELQARVDRYLAVIDGLREFSGETVAAAMPAGPTRGRTQPERAKVARPKVQRTAAPTAAKRRSSAVSDAQVLAVVAREKGATASQVVAACGCSMAVAWARLQQLVTAGVLAKGDDKRYRRVVHGTDTSSPAVN